MKNLLLLTFVFFTGCDGIATWLDGEISLTAKQKFLAAGGTTVEVKEASAIAPVQAPAFVYRDAAGQPTGEISFPIGTQCTQHWLVDTLGNYDPFWLGNGEPGAPSAWFVTYDSAEPQCGARRCGGNYVAQMDSVTPTLGVVTIGCSVP